MNKFEQGPQATSFEDMDFQQLESDPQYGPMLQEAALLFLKTEDREYFEREFSGELDEEGYLLKKDGGNSNTKPSQNIGGGKAIERVLAITKEKIRNNAK